MVSSSNDAEQLHAVETTLEVEAAGTSSRLWTNYESDFT